MKNNEAQQNNDPSIADKAEPVIALAGEIITLVISKNISNKIASELASGYVSLPFIINEWGNEIDRLSRDGVSNPVHVATIKTLASVGIQVLSGTTLNLIAGADAAFEVMAPETYKAIQEHANTLEREYITNPKLRDGESWFNYISRRQLSHDAQKVVSGLRYGKNTREGMAYLPAVIGDIFSENQNQAAASMGIQLEQAQEASQTEDAGKTAVNSTEQTDAFWIANGHKQREEPDSKSWDNISPSIGVVDGGISVGITSTNNPVDINIGIAIEVGGIDAIVTEAGNRFLAGKRFFNKKIEIYGDRYRCTLDAKRWHVYIVKLKVVRMGTEHELKSKFELEKFDPGNVKTQIQIKEEVSKLIKKFADDLYKNRVADALNNCNKALENNNFTQARQAYHDVRKRYKELPGTAEIINQIKCQIQQKEQDYYKRCIYASNEQQLNTLRQQSEYAPYRELINQRRDNYIAERVQRALESADFTAAKVEIQKVSDVTRLNYMQLRINKEQDNHLKKEIERYVTDCNFEAARQECNKLNNISIQETSHRYINRFQDEQTVLEVAALFEHDDLEGAQRACSRIIDAVNRERVANAIAADNERNIHIKISLAKQLRDEALCISNESASKETVEDGNDKEPCKMVSDLPLSDVISEVIESGKPVALEAGEELNDADAKIIQLQFINAAQNARVNAQVADFLAQNNFEAARNACLNMVDGIERQQLAESIDIANTKYTYYQLKQEDAQTEEQLKTYLVAEDFNEARQLCKKFNNQDMILLYQQHINVCEDENMHILVANFLVQEKFEDARNLCRQIINEDKRKLLSASIEFAYAEHNKIITWRLLEQRYRRIVDQLDSVQTDWAQLETQIIEALDLHPDYLGFKESLVSCYYKQGKYKEVLSYTQAHMLDSCPDNLFALSMKGAAQINMGHVDDGRATLQKVLSQSPQHTFTHDVLFTSYEDELNQLHQCQHDELLMREPTLNHAIDILSSGVDKTLAAAIQSRLAYINKAQALEIERDKYKQYIQDEDQTSTNENAVLEEDPILQNLINQEKSLSARYYQCRSQTTEMIFDALYLILRNCNQWIGLDKEKGTLSKEANERSNSLTTIHLLMTSTTQLISHYNLREVILLMREEAESNLSYALNVTRYPLLALPGFSLLLKNIPMPSVLLDARAKLVSAIDEYVQPLLSFTLSCGFTVLEPGNIAAGLLCLSPEKLLQIPVLADYFLRPDPKEFGSFFRFQFGEILERLKDTNVLEDIAQSMKGELPDLLIWVLRPQSVGYLGAFQQPIRSWLEWCNIHYFAVPIVVFLSAWFAEIKVAQMSYACIKAVSTGSAKWSLYRKEVETNTKVSEDKAISSQEDMVKLLEHWKLASKAASFCKTEKTLELDRAFEAYATATSPSEADKRQLLATFEDWIKTKENSGSKRFNLVTNIHNRINNGFFSPNVHNDNHYVGVAGTEKKTL